jgi:hypothetical protein
MIDDVAVTPPAPGSPTISSVVGCNGAAATTVINGQHFLLGSKVEVDERDVATLSLSSDRVEVAALAAGPHSIRVIGPDKDPGSAAFAACPAPPPSQPGPGSGGSGSGSSGSSSSTSHPTKHAIERGRPAVDLRNGEIAAEFEFPEPGKADYTAVVGQGASLARVASGAMASLAAPLAALADLGGVRATAAASKKCKKNYVRKNGKCVDNAPVGYGHASTTITKAGRYRVVITPAGPVRKALKKGKTLHVRLTLTFIPAGTDLHLITATTVTVHLKTKH